ncbi:HD domain-containing phosphohydrolase [Candidatus Desulforudis audaxviator]|uniref:HD domain-containing phosphohydrolase n=1 Tax=Candidatus Desulforudis audaxviator TaxID=471827 RepID=UPI00107B0728|nr:HD domain-containing phosphohydrolase [Candidatus Desulforudis audaxviator]AZK59286.1 GAF domain/HD domain protein [Candidatus Desulforudis audaxviator]
MRASADFSENLERVGFWQLQDHIAGLTGLALIVADAGGRPVTVKSNVPPFCVLVNGTYDGKIACEAFRVELVRAAAASGKVEKRACHAGLVNVAVPLEVHGETAAVLIGGGVAPAPLGAEAVARLAEELGCEAGELSRAAGEVPVWPEERLAEAAALFQTLTRFAGRFLQFTRMFTHVLRVGNEIASQHSERAVLRRAVEGASEVLDAPLCLLRLYDEKTGCLAARAAWGIDEDLMDKIMHLPVEGTIAGQVFRSGRPLIVEDVQACGDRMLFPRYAAAMRTALVVPVRSRGATLGTLAVYGPAPRKWDEASIGYLAAIGTKVALAIENARMYALLREHYLTAVKALAVAMEVKDVYTQGHSVRVAQLSRACARELGLSGEALDQIYLAGLLHDIGKIGVPESILLKPGRLSAVEWEEVRGHPVVGARIVEPARFPAAVVAVVRHHHEDYGGGGYPDGLAGEEIPLLARIIRVADAYDAMTSTRPYRRGLTAEEAIEELRRGAGRQFDPRVVEAFLRIPAAELEETGRGGGGGYPDYPSHRDFVRSLFSRKRRFSAVINGGRDALLRTVA